MISLSEFIDLRNGRLVWSNSHQFEVPIPGYDEEGYELTSWYFPTIKDAKEVAEKSDASCVRRVISVYKRKTFYRWEYRI